MLLTQCLQDETLGARVLDIPIQIEDGPCYTVQLRVNLTIPELVLSSDKLDFGSIVVGQCRTITVQLHNNKVGILRSLRCGECVVADIFFCLTGGSL